MAAEKFRDLRMTSARLQPAGEPAPLGSWAQVFSGSYGLSHGSEIMFPKLYLVKQTFPRPRIEAVKSTVYQELEKLGIRQRLPKGSKVAITAGSRGINKIVEITRYIVDYLKENGFEPRLIAAMGSHGGGTAEGQRAILNSLGLTPEAVGAPVLTGAETVEVGKTPQGLIAYINRHIRDVDGVIVLNRIKVHTALMGDMQSGLTKMCVVGLGGPSGAQQFHSLGIRELPACLREIGTILMEKTPILGGLAIIENGFEETAHIIGVEARKFIEEEPKLLAMATKLLPLLPVDKLDILVIEEMGKDYSGTCIDTNVVGRFRVKGEPEPETPFIKRIVVLDISEGSHGNANGVGLADLVTDKLVGKIDLKSTYLNVVTTGFVQRCFIPLHFPSEKETIEMAIASLGRVAAKDLRLMVIPTTLHLERVYASEALVAELKAKPGVEVMGEAMELAFDASGNMVTRLMEHKTSPEHALA